MIIKGLVDEDFTNYKKPSMFIIFPNCSFKCEAESGVHCCQNSDLAKAPIIDTDITTLVVRYIQNPITSAIVFGGMEPMDSWKDVQQLVSGIRSITLDDIVIYTGYYPEEIQDKINWLIEEPNIIIKFGRFIPNASSRYDDVLGITLMSNNQYAVRIS